MILVAVALLSSSPGERSGRPPTVYSDIIRCSQANKAPLNGNRTVFFGDSITAFWGNQQSFARHPTWLNKGRGGDTAQNSRWRLCRDVIEVRPATVHLMFGTNDIAGNAGPHTVQEIVGYVIQTAETLRVNGVKVVLGSILPAAQFPWNKQLTPSIEIVAVNKAIKAYATKKCFSYADYWSAMATTNGAMQRNLSDDGVHPNTQGYAVMQPIAERAIAEAKLGCGVRHG